VINGLELHLPSEALEAIAQRAAALAVEQLKAGSTASPWLSGADSVAAYLGWPRERVYKRLAEIPHVRHGARIMCRRDELDRWLESHRPRGQAP
jgi:hypothetical protein